MAPSLVRRKTKLTATGDPSAAEDPVKKDLASSPKPAVRRGRKKVVASPTRKSSMSPSKAGTKRTAASPARTSASISPQQGHRVSQTKNPNARSAGRSISRPRVATSKSPKRSVSPAKRTAAIAKTRRSVSPSKKTNAPSPRRSRSPTKKVTASTSTTQQSSRSPAKEASAISRGRTVSPAKNVPETATGTRRTASPSKKKSATSPRRSRSPAKNATASLSKSTAVASKSRRSVSPAKKTTASPARRSGRSLTPTTKAAAVLKPERTVSPAKRVALSSTRPGHGVTPRSTSPSKRSVSASKQSTASPAKRAKTTRSSSPAKTMSPAKRATITKSTETSTEGAPKTVQEAKTSPVRGRPRKRKATVDRTFTPDPEPEPEPVAAFKQARSRGRPRKSPADSNYRPSGHEADIEEADTSKRGRKPSTARRSASAVSARSSQSIVSTFSDNVHLAVQAMKGILNRSPSKSPAKSVHWMGQRVEGAGRSVSDCVPHFKADDGSETRSPSKSPEKSAALSRIRSPKRRVTKDTASPTRSPTPSRYQSKTVTSSVTQKRKAESQSGSPTKRTKRQTAASPAGTASQTQSRSQSPTKRAVRARTTSTSRSRSRSKSPTKNAKKTAVDATTKKRKVSTQDENASKRSKRAATSKQPASPEPELESTGESNRSGSRSQSRGPSRKPSQRPRSGSPRKPSASKKQPAESTRSRLTLHTLTNADLQHSARSSEPNPPSNSDPAFSHYITASLDPAMPIPNKQPVGNVKRPRIAQTKLKSSAAKDFDFRVDVLLSPPWPDPTATETDPAAVAAFEGHAQIRVMNKLNILRKRIRNLSREWFGFDGGSSGMEFSDGVDDDDDEEGEGGRDRTWRKLVRNGMPSRELILYAGFVCGCGKSSAEAGWDMLLRRPDFRIAMVCGILWKAVRENVLESLLFGGTEKQISALEKIQAEMTDPEAEKDGFERTAQRAVDINEMLKDARTRRPPQYHRECIRVVAQLYTMLAPLQPRYQGYKRSSYTRYDGADDLPSEDIVLDPLFQDLHDIVKKTADLALDIRTQENIVYYFEPIFKGTDFEPERLTCANLTWTQVLNPHSQSKGGNADLRKTDAVAVVKVVCFDGLTAYRKGGAELAKEYLQDEQMPDYWEANGLGRSRNGGKIIGNREREIEHKPSNGFRSRVLAKGVVALDWEDRPNTESKKRKKNRGEEDQDPNSIELLELVMEEVAKMEKEDEADERLHSQKKRKGHEVVTLL